MIGLMLAFVRPGVAGDLHVGPSQQYSTISAAVTAAVDGDTLHVHAGSYAETVILVDRDLSIVGDGSDLTTLYSNAGSDVVVVHGGSVVLEDLTVDGSSARRGIRVESSATLDLRDVKLTYGSAPNGADGGNLYAVDSSVIATGLTVEEGYAARGGGVFAQDSNVDLVGCEFSENSTNMSGGDDVDVRGDLSQLVRIEGCSFQTSYSSWYHLYFDRVAWEVIATDSDGYYNLRSSFAPTGSITDSTFRRGSSNFDLDDAITIEDSRFCGGASVMASNVGSVAIRNSVIEGMVNVRSDLVTFEHNVVSDAWYGGMAPLTLTGDSMLWIQQEGVVRNNIFFDSTATDTLVRTSSSSAVIDYNLFWNANKPHTYAHNFVADPRFASSASDLCSADLLPRWDSPVLDAGDPDSPEDPDGSIADIGIYGGPNADPSLFADADEDGSTVLFDCDESDEDIHADAPELCDGKDNDCDGSVDEATPIAWFPDDDGDGYGASSPWQYSCVRPDGDWTHRPGDCDDADGGRFPGNADVCDGIDNDCVGPADNDPRYQPTWHYDWDGDGWGEIGLDQSACTQPPNYVEDAGDCEPYDETVYPGATEICGNFVDEDCSGVADDGGGPWTMDYDNDGYGRIDLYMTPSVACAKPTGMGVANSDCDDWSVTRHPGADEVCNTFDDDCDGEIDEGVSNGPYYVDGDYDGYGAGLPVFACSKWGNYVLVDGDCDDMNVMRHPGADDFCDGIDQDCDGELDEDSPGVGPYGDNDRDGHFSDFPNTWMCSGRADPGDDCDDWDADVHGGAKEVCDFLDTDCDGDFQNGFPLTTWYVDADGDGYGTDADAWDGCASPQVLWDEIVGEWEDTGIGGPPQGLPVDRGLGDWSDQSGDCDDADRSVHPDATEYCNGDDDDCDDEVDDVESQPTWFADADGDGAAGFTWVNACFSPGAGYQSSPTDCDDADDATWPGADEVCDGEDNDCDDKVDEGLDKETWYRDADKDGFGDATVTEEACGPPSKYVSDSSDCDDSDSDTNPDAVDDCADSLDQDCTGSPAECGGLDADADGWCTGLDACPDPLDEPGDCDDERGDVNPGASDVCDGADNDCDGDTDEDLTVDGDGDDHSTPTSCGGTKDDCDDSDRQIHPEHRELCNLLDDDCDGVADDGLWLDSDGDGFPSADSCASPWEELDCDDELEDVHPGASEIQTNGVDDDCDGAVDEDPLRSDDDGDGYCEDAAACEDGSEVGDCDDANASTHPDGLEVPDGADNDCDGTVDELADDDFDGDGASMEEGDCNDLDPRIRPSAPEICDGFDTNCDGYMPISELDQDADGSRVCEGDCDDDASSVRPGNAEDCSDGVDNDCNGLVDEDADADQDGFHTCDGDCDDDDDLVYPGAPELCDDADNDCDQVVDEEFDADHDAAGDCASCEAADCDCDDRNALVGPEMPERCGDEVDNDCDGDVDGATDHDGDHYTTCEGDCDDGDAFVSPGWAEVCDGRDNDCDGEADEGLDLDGDGWLSCAGDCDDDDGLVHVLAEELCNEADEDCDGLVDEEWVDVDGDGVLPCLGDCDDDDPDVAPGIPEVCDDDKDNDCDLRTDDEDPLCDDVETEGGPGEEPSKVGSGFFQCAHGSGGAAWLGLIGVALVRRRSWTRVSA